MSTKNAAPAGRLWALGLVVAAFTFPAMAQAPGWAAGSWKGTLDAYRNDPAGADRALVISADGKCGWDYTVAAAAAGSGKQSCTVAGDSVSILTGAGSTIKLRYNGGKLEGTFQTKAGRSYLITMTKQ
ncbi:MAG: hypothetical protein Q8L39_09020 [Burkholderiales bacterium]|nr:hypothetical protein [Burkholderiales bacterium]